MNDRKKLAQFILLMFITGLMLYLCWQMLLPFISIILWSVILVIIFHPFYRKIYSRTKNHTVSAIITIAISLLTFIIPVMLVSAAAINELAGFAGTTISYIQQVIADPQHSQLGYLYNYINGFVNLEEVIKPEDIKSLATNVSQMMLSASWYVIEGVFGTFIGILFAIFSMYYLFRDGEKIVADLPGILPMDNGQAKELIRETSDLINATIRGSLFVAVVQGTLAGIMFWILGIPSYILLGVITMIFALIPTGGTAFVTVPIIVILAISGQYWKAGILAAYAAVVIGMIDNFLLPRMIKQRAKMNELFVFFSVVGGLQLFGILGLFMGPIILAIALGLLTVFKGEKINTDTISVQ
ncbi:MAG TPA: AI-2E family transporter [Ignavibacteria bacterium]|nr:AI-2E family transporter [Ignavibacteria bacterium]